MFSGAMALKETAGVSDSAEDPHRTAQDSEIAQRVARLSAGQLDCLILVDQHLN